VRERDDGMGVQCRSSFCLSRAINASISSTAHIEQRPILTGGGNSPVAMREYQLERESGIGPAGAMMLLSLKNPVRRGSLLFGIGSSSMPKRIMQRAHIAAKLVKNRNEFMINSVA